MKVVSVIKASPYLSNTFDEPGSGRKQAAAVITYFFHVNRIATISIPTFFDANDRTPESCDCAKYLSFNGIRCGPKWGLIGLHQVSQSSEGKNRPLCAKVTYPVVGHLAAVGSEHLATRDRLGRVKRDRMKTAKS